MTTQTLNATSLLVWRRIRFATAENSDIVLKLKEKYIKFLPSDLSKYIEEGEFDDNVLDGSSWLDKWNIMILSAITSSAIEVLFDIGYKNTESILSENELKLVFKRN